MGAPPLLQNVHAAALDLAARFQLINQGDHVLGELFVAGATRPLDGSQLFARIRDKPDETIKVTLNVIDASNGVLLSRHHALDVLTHEARVFLHLRGHRLINSVKRVADKLLRTEGSTNERLRFQRWDSVVKRLDGLAGQLTGGL